MTKIQFEGAKLLEHVQRRWRLARDPQFERARRREAKGLHIMEEVPAKTDESDKAGEIAKAKIGSASAAGSRMARGFL